MSGLTSAGFEKKPLDDIGAEIESAQRSNISPRLNLTAAGAIGQVNGVIIERLDELWKLLQAIYSSGDPDQATGDQLASLAQITGTKKRPATKSIVTGVLVNLNAGFTLPAGAVASIVDFPTRRFVSRAAATNGSGSPAAVAVDFEGETAGPLEAPAGTLTVIAQPVSGWNSVTNPLDAVVGKDVETNAELRARRDLELEASGSTNVDALRSDILQNLGQANSGDVISAMVLGNDTDVTDANGLPPHSIEAIVRGVVADTAADKALANQIWLSKAAGDQAVGTSSKTVTDSQGNVHVIGFTRPAVVPIYMTVIPTTDPALYPADGDAQVAAAIVAWGDANLAGGDDVIAERLKAVCFTVPGVIDVPTFKLGTTAFPAGTANISISIRQIADLDTSRTLVGAP